MHTWVYGIFGENFEEKMPGAVRVWFWRFGTTAPMDSKQGLFRYAFPFERNRNRCSRASISSLECSDTPSYLNGIETRASVLTPASEDMAPVYPVPRESKEESYGKCL